ncbi:MAG TPA: hypothetical protein VII06_25585 [Chloroflexota bacterium]|jgi:two-component sensor histidine kinase
MTQDITDRKRAEQALQEAARLEGILIAAREIVHLLNNDLQHPTSLVDLLQEGSLSPERLQLLTAEASAALARAAHHVDQLRRVVRVATHETATGPALDLDRSTQPGAE